MEPLEPLTPPNCDLSDFQYMELDVRRLRDSKFSAATNSESFRAGILLWCAAWHQIPAASLPDDDIELANLAGYGRVIKVWKKIRTEALYGFVKCSDGRLYHPVIAEKAIAAFAAKSRHAYGKFLERLRKENGKRIKENKEPFGIPAYDLWNSGNYPHGIPPEGSVENEQIPQENAVISKVNGTENALRGNRTEQRGNGEGTELSSVTVVTGGNAAKSPDEMTKDELWAVGKSLLLQSGMPKVQCGSFVGKLCSDYGNEIVIAAVRTTCVNRPVDPAEYLKALCMRAKGERSNPNRQEALEASNNAVAEKFLKGLNREPH